MSKEKRVLRVQVTKDGDPKVNIRVPLGLAKLARIGGVQDALKKRDIDIDEILDEIEDTPDGKIVDVVDEKSGDHVEIYIETVGASVASA